MNTEIAFADFTQAFRDFRGTSWGMSKEEVKFSEYIAPLNEGEGFISYRERVMGLDAVVAFHFLEGSLVEAGYARKGIKDGQLAATKALFAYAVENDLLPVNPALGVKLLSKLRGDNQGE